MKSIRGSFIGLCIIFCIHLADGGRKSEWWTDFVKHVVENKKEYQVLLLSDPNDRSGVDGIDDLTRGISRRLPTIEINSHDATKNRAEELSELAPFGSPRSTMTVIIHLSQDPEYMSQLHRLIDFVSNISESRTRSKCLIVLRQEQKRFAYVTLLQQLWKKQFLDVTILELLGRTGSYRNATKDIAVIHQWNPFKKGYNRSRFTPEVSWFPDKTQNMHGHRIKVGLFDFPPNVFLRRDDKVEVQNPTGPDVEVSRVMSEAMNFNIEWIAPKNETSWGDSRGTREDTTGHMYRITHNEIRFIVAECGRYANAEEHLYEWRKGTRFVKQVVVVPITEDEPVQILASWKKFNALLLSGFFLMIWMLSRVMNFDRSTWSLLNIKQLVFGYTTPREPQILVERFVFGAILLSCMLHSSFIFTAITDVSLTKTPEKRLETIEDVVSSNLHNQVDESFHMLYENSKGSSRSLLDSSEIVDDYKRCWDDLLKHKNCSFIDRMDVANWMIGSRRDSLGRPLAKVVKEPLRHTVSGLIMESRSPYVERFDQVLLRLEQSGLVDKWQRTNYNGFLEINMDDLGSARGSELISLRKQVTHILLFGYALAIVVYFIEVLWYFFKKKVNRQDRNRGL